MELNIRARLSSTNSVWIVRRTVTTPVWVKFSVKLLKLTRSLFRLWVRRNRTRHYPHPPLSHNRAEHLPYPRLLLSRNRNLFRKVTNRCSSLPNRIINPKNHRRNPPGHLLSLNRNRRQNPNQLRGPGRHPNRYPDPHSEKNCKV